MFTLLNSQLRRNILAGAAAAILSSIAGLLAYPVYLHFLGYERYGLWIILSTVLTLAQMGNLGISSAIIKFVAEEYARGDIGAIQSYVTTSCLALFMSGTFILLVVLAFANKVASAFGLTGDGAVCVIRLLPYVGLLSIYVFVVDLVNSTLSGLGRLDLASAAQTMAQILNVIFGSALLVFGRGIDSLLIGSALSYIILHIASLLLVRGILRAPLIELHAWDKNRLRRILNLGKWMFATSALLMLLSPFNKIMLSRFAGVASIPVYEIAYGSAFRIRSLIESGLRALIPEISRLSAGPELQPSRQMVRVNRRALQSILLLGAPLYVTIIGFATPISHLWLRSQYVSAFPNTLRFICLATFLNLIAVPAYYTLLGLGKTRECFVANLIQVGINVCVMLVVVYVFHALTAISASFGLIAGMAASTIYILSQSRSAVSRVGTLKADTDAYVLGIKL